MKLYRLTVVGGQVGLDRGVWAEKMQEDMGSFRFFVQGELVASYPISRTAITSIETKEDYDTRKKRDEDYTNRLSK